MGGTVYPVELIRNRHQFKFFKAETQEPSIWNRVEQVTGTPRRPIISQIYHSKYISINKKNTSTNYFRNDK